MSLYYGLSIYQIKVAITAMAEMNMADFRAIRDYVDNLAIEKGERKMKYFKLSMKDAGIATEKVWKAQEQAGLKKSLFHMSGSLEVSVWTEDQLGEIMLQNILKAMKIQYEESDKQQVKTFLDEYFGDSDKIKTTDVDKIEVTHCCEVCHKKFTESALIAVDDIEYLKWERTFPWYICVPCAQKISDALKEEQEKRE